MQRSPCHRSSAVARFVAGGRPAPGLPSTSMAARPFRMWMLITGVVLVVLQGLLVLAWWMLPRWTPILVITHAPWPEPALRAWRWAGESATGSLDVQQALEARLLVWGADIGPALRYEFDQGDERVRLRVIALASEVARADGIAAGTIMPDDRRQYFTAEEVTRLREDLLQLVLAAMADGSSYLPSNASYVAMSLRDARMVPPACDFLAKQTPPIFEDLEPVVRFLGIMRDPRAVPALIPLLPVRHKPHPTVEEALDQCLADESVTDVIAATHHEHEVVRTWAAHRFARFHRSPELTQRVVALIGDHERQVALAAVVAVTEHAPGAAGPTLLEVARSTKDERVQSFAVRALGEVRFGAARPYLRDLARGREDWIGQRAITALSQFRDAADVDLLLSLVTRPGVAEAAITALRQMPLSDAQRRQLDAARVTPTEPTP